jgi:site-specific recombinase XerD
MTATDFAARLTAFLTRYLPAQRNVSPNTIQAYRDVFILLLRYLRDERGLAPERLRLDQIDVPLVLAFLEYLEQKRHCSARTRNHRLATLHSFFRYLQAEAPERMLQCQQILAIPFRRCAHAPVGYLTAEELAAIFAQPDLSRREGRRDAVLLSVLYDTGTRCQELIDLSVRDVRLETPAQIRVAGKGRKTRLVPLMSNTVEMLNNYTREVGLDRPERRDEPLFQNRRGGRLSRSGVRYILDKYTEKARISYPSLKNKISPHTLRHSKAMHLLQTGNPPTVIRDILGHADIKTTEVYARADIDMKRRALEKAASASPPVPAAPWRADTTLMEWLRSL